MSRCTEHLKETTFSCGIDKLMNGNISLNYLELKLFFDLVFHVQNTLSHNTVENAFVIVGGQKFKVAETRLLDHKHVESGQLLDGVVEHPKNIIKSIVLGVLN